MLKWHDVCYGESARRCFAVSAPEDEKSVSHRLPANIEYRKQQRSVDKGNPGNALPETATRLSSADFGASGLNLSIARTNCDVPLKSDLILTHNEYDPLSLR